VYTGMDWWTGIGLEVLRGESKKREILRRERIHWETLKMILAHPEPPGYRLREPPSRRLVPTLSGSLRSSKKTKALILIT